ncbi:MAG: FAD-dependent oxidoreductase [Bacteroidota bacterium]
MKDWFNHLSYWEKSTFFEGIDLAIIGSGIVGLNAAIHFKETYPTAKVVVLERGILPSGASTKNAGFACFGSVSELMDDLAKMGPSVFDLVAKRWRSLQRLKERCGEQSIDYQKLGGYELYLEDEVQGADFSPVISYLNEELASITGEAEVFSLSNDLNKFQFGKVSKLIFNSAEGQLNPAKMMRRLQQIASEKGVPILTGIEVTAIEPQTNEVQLVVGSDVLICAAKVLVATNGFTKQLLPKMDVQPARNQVLITEPIPNLAVKGTFHYNQGYYYFRNVGNRILLGGARNIAKRAEKTEAFGLTPLIQNTLEEFLDTVILPNKKAKIAHRWSGILGVGKRKTPLVKKVDKRVGIAVRLGGMGVAIGTLVGEEGAELVA